MQFLIEIQDENWTQDLSIKSLLSDVSWFLPSHLQSRRKMEKRSENTNHILEMSPLFVGTGKVIEVRVWIHQRKAMVFEKKERYQHLQSR